MSRSKTGDPEKKTVLSGRGFRQSTENPGSKSEEEGERGGGGKGGRTVDKKRQGQKAQNKHRKKKGGVEGSNKQSQIV